MKLEYYIFQTVFFIAGAINTAYLFNTAKKIDFDIDIGTINFNCSAIAVLLILLGLINFKLFPERKQKAKGFGFFLVLNSPSVLLLWGEVIVFLIILLHVIGFPLFSSW